MQWPAVQVERGIDLVYGGGSIGLMGSVSHAVHAGGRHVMGLVSIAISHLSPLPFLSGYPAIAVLVCLGAVVVVFACHGALWSWGLPVWALCFQAPTHCTKTAALAAEMPALFRQSASCWGRLGAPLPVGGAGGKPCRLHSFHRSGSNFWVFFSKG